MPDEQENQQPDSTASSEAGGTLTKEEVEDLAAVVEAYKRRRERAQREKAKHAHSETSCDCYHCSRDAELAALGAVQYVVETPFRILDSLVRAGREYEKGFYHKRPKHIHHCDHCHK